MSAVHPMHPRATSALRNVQAARLAANTWSLMPVGFWQRRVAARAFGLPVVPPVDRDTANRAICWTLGGTDPVFVLETAVALWGIAPDADRDPVGVLQMLRAVGPRPFTAVITVVPRPTIDLVRAPRPRRVVLPSDALQIGVLYWHDACAVFEDAVEVLDHGPTVALARQSLATLRTLTMAEVADHGSTTTPACTAGSPWPGASRCPDG